MVADRRITAYDVRICIEEDADLVGRNVLLIREAGSPAGLLTVAIEGGDHHQAELKARLRERLGVDTVRIVWLGDLRVNWGFRQVVDSREIRSAGS